jgi:CDP-paratose 2-epimerase
MRVLIAGSAGLIGSEAVRFFDDLGFDVTGVDNNMRADFFGPNGDTTSVRKRLEEECRSYRHVGMDIRDRDGIAKLFAESKFDLTIHAAAQPSHDLAAKRPFDDFDTNAVGTLNLLEAFRNHGPEGVFIHLSTNKVYGDGPNHVPMRELETRWDFDDPKYADGIAEDFPVDQCLHSLFGVSKAAADLLAQEYGRYFGLNVGVFRGGCLTGSSQSGVELHGFLNYLVRQAIVRGPYTIFGYEGKQVRDQIHSRDVIAAFWEFAQNPRPGEVYNLGGGKENSASILECIELIESCSGRRPVVQYDPTNRVGDHICYYTNLAKLRGHYPSWELTYSRDQIIEELVKNVVDKELV